MNFRSSLSRPRSHSHFSVWSDNMPVHPFHRNSLTLFNASLLEKLSALILATKLFHIFCFTELFKRFLHLPLAASVLRTTLEISTFWPLCSGHRNECTYVAASLVVENVNVNYNVMTFSRNNQTTNRCEHTRLSRCEELRMPDARRELTHKHQTTSSGEGAESTCLRSDKKR